MHRDTRSPVGYEGLAGTPGHRKPEGHRVDTGPQTELHLTHLERQEDTLLRQPLALREFLKFFQGFQAQVRFFTCR